MFIHKIKHLFGWYPGKIYTWTETEGFFNHVGGRSMVGFRCTVWGDISGVHCMDPVIDRLLDER